MLAEATKWADKIQDELDEAALSSTWIHWLIAAEVDAAGDQKPFVERLRAWLGELQGDGKMFTREWPLLARLTADLPGSAHLRDLYPTFSDVVLPEKGESSELDKARRAGLKKMGAGICLAPSLDVWRNMLHRVVPNPAVAPGSNYDRHAAWMKALYELSDREYERVLARWRKTHTRRRNLWRDMGNLGLPL